VALNIKAKSKKKSLNVKNYKLGAKTMPTVESAVHLGINRTTLLTENMTRKGSDICPAHLIELSAFSCRLLIRTQCLLSIPA
jgi:hypothetical protein